MITVKKTVNPNSFSDMDLDLAAKIIQSGGLVAFPTETVYGLGANALDRDAADRIFEAKMRPHDNPLIVHVSSPDDFGRYADITGQHLLPKLAQSFMPGPLTVILQKKEIIPDSVTVGLDTVALRCPSHPVARALIRVSKRPIAAPSANRSGRPSPTTASHVAEDMDGKIPLILDGGPCEVGLESTVIALNGDEIRLLRPGFITKEDLLEVTENLVVSPAVLSALKENEKVESPGMKYRHYAPKAPVTMVRGREEAVLAFFREKLAQGCGVLCYDEDLPHLSRFDSKELLISFGSRENLLSQACGLFDALRRFDQKETAQIYARETCQSDLGLAISNRLLRACAFQILEVKE